MNKEKLVLAKLLKIAEKQQKIIQKISVMSPVSPQQDPNIEYLMTAMPVAAANAGINNVVVIKVDKNTDTYLAHIKGILDKQGATFKKTWDQQLASQKPDLVGRVGFVLEN